MKSRAQFLIALAATLVLSLALAIPAAAQYNQSPMLDPLVESGELPPVEERLPLNPRQVEVVDRIGQYGGTLYGVGVSTDGLRDTRQMLGAQTLIKTGRDGLEPNVVDFEMAEDASSITLYLREGMKWSDGEPFTADDLLFWYEDILKNEELTPAVPSYWEVEGELFEMVKVDDYTVRMEFGVSYPSVIFRLAHTDGYDMLEPAHYLKQFHADYLTDEEVEQMVAEHQGMDTWYDVFNAKAQRHVAIPMREGLPTLQAYIVESERNDGYNFVRNPYFYKVDAAGNQLPYIDRVETTGVPSPETFNAKILSGEVDLTTGFQTSVDNAPLFKMGEPDGNYTMLLWETGDSADIYFSINQTIDDPELRPIFQDKRFRQAISLALDRDEINNTIFHGLGKPVQLTLRSDAVYFEPEFETAYVDHDPERANALLDEMGLEWDSNGEYRLTQGGERIGWTIEYLARAESWTKTAELAVEYWKDLGFDVNMRQVEGGIYDQNIEANSVDMTVWHADNMTGNAFSILTGHGRFVPNTQPWHSSVAPLWVDWYMSDGEDGEEPPAQVKEMLEQTEIVINSPDEQARIEAGKRILEYQAENLSSIGVISIPKPVMKKNDLHNVPEQGVVGWDFLGIAYVHPSTFFFDPPRN